MSRLRLGWPVFRAGGGFDVAPPDTVAVPLIAPVTAKPGLDGDDLKS